MPPLARRAKKMQAGRVTDLLQRAEAQILRRHLFQRGRKILVAVSGGADSMALLRILNSLAKTHRWKIAVAHFNHRLRGRASDADERLVRQTAAGLKLPVVVGSADVKAFAAKSKFSVEMAARKLRHEFFVRAARKLKIPTIALAHHADDQVELFFLRLLRGAGGEGLAGMKWRSPSPADRTISLVRPLLEFSKTELLEFVRAGKIRCRDDATNFSTDFLRNRIRNELLPLLRKKYQPGLDKVVLRLMEIVGAEADFVGETARAAAPAAFGELPVAVQRRVLQMELAGAGVVADFDLVEQLRAAPGKSVSAGPNLSVTRDAGGRVELRSPSVSEFDPTERKLKLSGRAGSANFSGRKFRWQIQPQKKFQLPKKHTGKMPVPQKEFFDAGKIGGEIILRHWRPGDRFQPIGLKSAVKLQDLFVNARIPAARRRELVLAAAADGAIFWVEGLRIGERFKLTARTGQKLRWQWQPV